MPTPDVAPAPGGKLTDLAWHIEQTGRTCALTHEGRQLWAPGARAELTRLPMTCTAPVDRAWTRQLLRTSGTWVVTYLLDGTDRRPPNSFLYLCRDSQYHMDKLSKNGRKAIRRGLRKTVIRRCTWGELAASGYAALAETDRRHGYKDPPPENFEQFVSLRRGTPFYEVWGSWLGNDLISWLVLMKIDEWALFEASPSRDAAMALYASNALRYEALVSLLVNEKRRQVLTGLSSINPNTDPRLIYKYNTRMGFEAVPFRRVFALHPLLSPLLNSRATAWLWTKISRALPQYSVLSKIGGMSQVLSEREKDVLAWAEEVR